MGCAKGKGYGGPIQRVGQVLCRLPVDADAGRGVSAVQGSSEEARARGSAEESSRNKGRPPKARDGKLGLSLRSHHAKLNNEGYVPPPPVEAPLVYAGKKSGWRVLTDEQVIEARKLIATINCRQLSLKYGVAYQVMRKAIKGLSYKHLNILHPPQA